MKYQCVACKRKFVHTAKKEVEQVSPVVIDTNPQIRIVESLETRVCPFCKSPNVDEFVEPQANGKVLDVVSTPYEGVRKYIKQGYEVHTIYAKSVTLILKEKEKQE